MKGCISLIGKTLNPLRITFLKGTIKGIMGN
jgi:hypothetical protein